MEYNFGEQFGNAFLGAYQFRKKQDEERVQFEKKLQQEKSYYDMVGRHYTAQEDISNRTNEINLGKVKADIYEGMMPVSGLPEYETGEYKNTPVSGEKYNANVLPQSLQPEQIYVPKTFYEQNELFKRLRSSGGSNSKQGYEVNEIDIPTQVKGDELAPGGFIIERGDKNFKVKTGYSKTLGDFGRYVGDIVRNPEIGTKVATIVDRYFKGDEGKGRYPTPQELGSDLAQFGKGMGLRPTDVDKIVEEYQNKFYDTFQQEYRLKNERTGYE